MKAEVCLLGPLKAAPVFQRGIQQAECADHVGLDKGPGPVDRSIDMAFGGEVHDRIDLFFAQQTKHHLAIEDIALDEPVVGRIGDCPQAFRVARIGQLVEVDDPLAFTDKQANHCRADKAGSAGDEDGFHDDQPSKVNGESNSANSGASKSLSESVGSPSIAGHSIPSAGSFQRIARSCSFE